MNNAETLVLKIITLKILLVFSLSVSAQTVTYLSVFMEKAPVLDGEINTDPAWNTRPWTGNFKKYRECTAASRKTSFKIGYTNDALYIAVDCEEPEMDKISIKRKDLGPLWHDDNIEIFLLTDKYRYRHFVINAAGARTNMLRVMGGNQNNKMLWEWQVKVKSSPKGWTAEIMIPVSLLNITQKMKSQLKFNIGRTATPINEISSWMPQKVSFHNTDNFANLYFAGKLSKQQLNKLNQEKEKQYILDKIANLEIKWKQFEQNLSKGDNKDDEKFANSYKSKINKLKLVFMEKNVSGEQKYQSIIMLLKSLEQEAIEFDNKLRKQIIEELTDNQ